MPGAWVLSFAMGITLHAAWVLLDNTPQSEGDEQTADGYTVVHLYLRLLRANVAQVHLHLIGEPAV